MSFPTRRAPRSGVHALTALAAAVVLASCVDAGEELPTSPPSANEPASFDAQGPQDFGPAIRAADRFTPGLLQNPAIVGTGVGLNPAGRPTVRLFLAHGQARDLPDQLDGVPVSTVVTGRFDARQDRTARARPAPIGFSVGHPSITAGTLGARVTDGSNIYILSNNHVIANSNNANIGDPTLQPGAFDGGSQPNDVIGTLHDFQTIVFGGAHNTMDAAVALVDGNDVSGAAPDGAAYGAPSTQIQNASVGMAVQKYGRTTGFTQGQVAEINVTVDVCYAGVIICTRSARFVNQFTITPGTFSAGGDSGSLIVSSSGNRPVGLLFAGSSTRTIANRIDLVLNRFGVSIDPTVPDGDPGDPDPTGPTASFTHTCTELACTFDGSGSSAGDAPISSHAWTFGDGNTGSGQTVSHTYASANTYTVTLTVTDAGGLTDSSSQQVTVSEAPGDGESSIDVFLVTTRATGPWQRADVTWTVSHSGGGLASVTTQLLGGGSVLDSQTSSVSGSSASGSHDLRTRTGNPDTVRLIVTDTNGAQLIQDVSVSF